MLPPTTGGGSLESKSNILERKERTEWFLGLSLLMDRALKIQWMELYRPGSSFTLEHSEIYDLAC